MEGNGYNIYTILSDGIVVNEEKSVLCSDGIPLIEYNMDACNGEDQYIMAPEKNTPIDKDTQALPTTAKTTEPWIRTMKTTTVLFAKTIPVLTTEEHPCQLLQLQKAED